MSKTVRGKENAILGLGEKTYKNPYIAHESQGSRTKPGLLLPLGLLNILLKL